MAMLSLISVEKIIDLFDGFLVSVAELETVLPLKPLGASLVSVLPIVHSSILASFEAAILAPCGSCSASCSVPSGVTSGGSPTPLKTKTPTTEDSFSSLGLDTDDIEVSNVNLGGLRPLGRSGA